MMLVDDKPRVPHSQIDMASHRLSIGSLRSVLVCDTPSYGWRGQMSVRVAYVFDGAGCWLGEVGVAHFIKS